MSFDDYIFLKPSFVGGMARVLDVSGAFGRAAFQIVKTPSEADARALASDFRATGRDLYQALDALRLDATK